MKWLLLVPGVILGLLLIALVKTLLTPAKKAAYVPRESEEESLGLARKLSRMVQVDTTSHSGVQEAEKFRNFHKTLEELFPLVFSRLEKTELDGNLLFYWKGVRGDKPILLMSHQDVVPAEGTWEHGPFSGDIADGRVYGSGYQMQCDGLSGSGGAAAGGRVYAPTGRVPCLLLHGGMGRRRRAQAGGGAAAPGRGAVSAV